MPKTTYPCSTRFKILWRLGRLGLYPGTELLKTNSIMAENTELAVAYEADNPTTAALAQQHIESHGIKCRLVGDALYNNTDVATKPRPQLLVQRSDLETAKKLVRDFEKTLNKPATDQPEWNCASCKELNPGEFDSCWSCQEAKPL